LGLLDERPKRRAVARFDPSGHLGEIQFHGATTSLGLAEWETIGLVPARAFTGSDVK
jgi:hypothetical protein